jgi:hypothetical protein
LNNKSTPKKTQKRKSPLPESNKRPIERDYGFSTMYYSQPLYQLS